MEWKTLKVEVSHTNEKGSYSIHGGFACSSLFGSGIIKKMIISFNLKNGKLIDSIDSEEIGTFNVKMKFHLKMKLAQDLIKKRINLCLLFQKQCFSRCLLNVG